MCTQKLKTFVVVHNDLGKLFHNWSTCYKTLNVMFILRCNFYPRELRYFRLPTKAIDQFTPKTQNVNSIPPLLILCSLIFWYLDLKFGKPLIFKHKKKHSSLLLITRPIKLMIAEFTPKCKTQFSFRTFCTFVHYFLFLNPSIFQVEI